MAETAGWLLDVYAHPQAGVTVWLLNEAGQAQQLRHPFRTAFHVAGPFPRLRELWRFLRQQPVPAALSRTRQRDLFAGELDVLTVESDVAHQPHLFRLVKRPFPELTYYNVDIPVSVQYAARFGLFSTLPAVWQHTDGVITQATPRASRWEIDAPFPPLKQLTITPEVDPAHREPKQLIVGYAGKKQSLSLENGRLLLLRLIAKLNRFDPDIILTQYGDTWLFPRLRQLADEHGLSFHPSRDPERPYLHKPANSYFTYGMVLHRGQQTYLYGRYHIDVKNALLFNEYDLSGVLEQARVTGMSVQEIARRSPGAGITACQMLTALHRGVLVPHTKQQVEYGKSARALLRADRGGLVFQPQIGLHEDVVEIDFVSMYPSIISLFNVSPETVNRRGEETAVVPELNMPVDQSRPGLLPETLRPLLEKRIAIKDRLADLTRHDCRYAPLKSRATALKWLLVVAFGYAGYKRARFGRIEAHEAITAYSREALLRAKETAESLGYEVIHLYVDGLWVKQPGIKTKTAVRPLLDAIEQATGLPIALEGFYKWIAFLPSRTDERVPVPNRYFGLFEHGELKVRGIALRRHDTPRFVTDVQHTLLRTLARAETLDDCLLPLIQYIRQQLEALRNGRIDPARLLVSQRLSRPWHTYKVPSPAARAAEQLAAIGKERHPGQRIQFVYTRDLLGVQAWDMPAPLVPTHIDPDRYIEMTLRAVDEILRPFGIRPEWLSDWLLSDWVQIHLHLPSPTRPPPPP